MPKRQDAKTDGELIALLREDPAEGLRQAMARYIGLVYTVTAGKLPSGEDVEECVSDVFLRFFEQRYLLDPEKGSLKAYLCTMAKRAAVDRFRKLKNRQTDSLEELEEGDRPPAAEDDVAADAERRETQERLIAAIRGLGTPDSEIMIRKYYLGQPTKQIARDVGLRPNTVDKRAARAREKLRHELGDDFYE